MPVDMPVASRSSPSTSSPDSGEVGLDGPLGHAGHEGIEFGAAGGVDRVGRGALPPSPATLVTTLRKAAAPVLAT